MCTSALQIVFTIVLVAGTAATLIAMFTPGWRSMKSTAANATIKAIKDQSIPDASGIFKFLCNDANTASASNGGSSTNACDVWWTNKADWEKVVIAGMCLALIAEVAAFAWSFVTCFMCCCKSCLTPPLPILTAIATICLLVAVILFGVKHKDQINSIPTNVGQLETKDNVGYSFWIAIVAVILMAVDTVIGVLLTKSAKVSPI
uniref:Uncharacterized protein n=1 Tax=Plectus sambesii TaxID=2011161 RepID=A0A914UMI0_9BILA